MSDSTKEAVKSLEQKPHNPFAGCFLIVFTVLVFIGIVVFAIYSGFRQNKAIDAFASPEPLELTPISYTEAEKSALVSRLESFSTNVKSERSDELELTVEALNQLIFMFDEGKELRDTFRIVSVSPALVEAVLTMKMNTLTLPWEEATGDRYLNIRLFGRTQLSDGELYLAVDECQAADSTKQIPEEFVANFDPYRIMLAYKEHPKISPVMLALTGQKQGAGTVTLSYSKNAPTPGIEELPDNPLEVDAVCILLSISVIFTFCLTGFLLWNKLRKKKKDQ